MAAFTCKLCGETIDGFAPSHYREAHPGEKSPVSHKRNRSEAKRPSVAGDAPSAPAAGGDSLFDTGEVMPDLPADIEAAPLEPARKSWRDRFWRGSDVSRETSRERRPTRKRESGVEVLGALWSGLGWAVLKTGADDPVGRVLQFQAPVAGEVLDKLVSGTIVDRALVQPIARNADQAEAATALFALPLLVFMWERAAPEGRLVLYPFMQEAMRANFVAMVPVLKKKKAEAAKFVNAVADLKAEGMIPDDVDAMEAVDAMLSAMLNGIDADPGPNGRVPNDAQVDDSFAR